MEFRASVGQTGRSAVSGRRPSRTAERQGRTRETVHAVERHSEASHQPVCGEHRRRNFDRRATMKIHEYQAKEVLRKFGVVTPRGIHCTSVEDAVKAAEELGGKIWVVKAQ